MKSKKPSICSSSCGNFSVRGMRQQWLQMAVQGAAVGSLQRVPKDTTVTFPGMQ